MKKVNIQRLPIAGILCVTAAVGSLCTVPVFGNKCAPVQHMGNILCADGDTIGAKSFRPQQERN